MSLLLTIEQGPRPQAVRQKRLESGELVIGRGGDAGWQIDDPEMFVSRAHCRISRRGDGYVVTDMSSSGLFIDDSASPVGQGNSIMLQDGMRLRLGDYVVGVDLASDAPAWDEPARPAAAGVFDTTPPQSKAGGSGSVGQDDFFSIRTEEEPKAPRPANLPDPFEQPVPGAYSSAASKPPSQAFDDPFSLDPVSDRDPDEASGGHAPATDPFAFDSFSAEPAAGPPPRESAPFGDFDFGADAGPPPNRVAPSPAALYLQGEKPAKHAPEAQSSPPPAPPPRKAAPAPEERRAPRRPAPEPVVDEEIEKPPAPPPRMPRAQHDTALRDAFLRGMGIAEASVPGLDPAEEMEKFGREYRLMMDGLMQLLRKRAEEKGNARVAQTVVGSSAVNPLKFLPTVDDAIVMILSGRSAGFLGGEAAIQDSVRDLAHHHVRAWRGVQTALRRMIDRFDPAALEAELKSGSSIGAMLPGGKGAKLWELYCKRHKEIAQSVETRFLGEVGADFRDAYEEG